MQTAVSLAMVSVTVVPEAVPALASPVVHGDAVVVEVDVAVVLVAVMVATILAKEAATVAKEDVRVLALVAVVQHATDVAHVQVNVTRAVGKAAVLGVMPLASLLALQAAQLLARLRVMEPLRLQLSERFTMKNKKNIIEAIAISAALANQIDPYITAFAACSCNNVGGFGACGCTGGCTGSCRGNCQGSCQGNCSGGCNGCLGSCQGGCQGSCNNGCYTGCNTGCNGLCKGSCTGGCSSSCNGCSSCTGQCNTDCGAGCNTGCSAACVALCATGCSTTCTTTCYGMVTN